MDSLGNIFPLVLFSLFKMFIYYNVIWIICIALLFASLFMFIKRRRARNLLNNGNYATPANPNYVIDMNGRQSYQPAQPTMYAPPSQSYPPQTCPPQTYPPPPTTSSSVDPPPPSYQDYSKDHRVSNLQ